MYKTLHWRLQSIIEIKEVPTKYRNMLSSWIRILNSVKKSVLSKLVYRFNKIPIKNPKGFYVEIVQQNREVYIY